MVEHRPLQIPAQLHFHHCRRTAEYNDNNGLNCQDSCVEQGEGPQPLGGSRLNEGFDGIGLEERVTDINRRADQLQKDDGEEDPIPVGPQEGPQLQPDL